MVDTSSSELFSEEEINNRSSKINTTISEDLMLNQMNLSKILFIFLPSDLILIKELLKYSFFIERVEVET